MTSISQMELATHCGVSSNGHNFESYA